MLTTEREILTKIIEDFRQPRWRSWLWLAYQIALQKHGYDSEKAREWLGFSPSDFKTPNDKKKL